MSKLIATERSRRLLSPMLWIAFATIIALGLSAGTAFAQSQTVEICHKGKTLSVGVNAVSAHLDHGDHVGSCETTCACTGEFDPVTCPDGRTYANSCLAECAGQTSGCTRLGVCSNIYNPVTCGGVVYANRCQALNAGCTDFTDLCACPQIYAPVRCSDGRIYINACVATCRGGTGCTPVE
jgi:hypothetical protein